LSSEVVGAYIPKEVEVTIQNMVASVTTGEAIDIDAVVRNFPSVKYRPETFPGLVFRLEKPKTTTLIFRSGKMICTGAKSRTDLEEAIGKVLQMLKKKGIISQAKPEIKVRNIVSTASLGGNIDLDRAAYFLGRTMYDPEQFPGAIYRMDEPKIVFLIFASGNVVILGAKSEDESTLAVRRLREIFEEKGMILGDWKYSSPSFHVLKRARTNRWFHGRPVTVSKP
jgi:transcription initiation factor TFIID TATA-box-binding protein